jgi:hypothetical protein
MPGEIDRNRLNRKVDLLVGSFRSVFKQRTTGTWKEETDNDLKRSSHPASSLLMAGKREC